MTKLKPLGIAVWGLGNHAWKNILPAIAVSKAVKLIGVYTRSISSQDRAISDYGSKTWTTAENMLNDPNVNAVYLATPTGLHFDQGMQVLKANKHLLCEKSLTDCAEKSFQLIALATQKKLVLLEAFMYLYHPQFLLAQDLIRQAEFGKILSITSSFGIPALPSATFRTSKELGGSALLDLGCYPISAAQQLLGEMPRLLQFTQDYAPEYDVDIAGSATLQYPAGSVAFLSWGYNRSYCADLVVSGEYKTIYIRRAFSKPADYETKISVTDKYGEETSIATKSANSFVNMLESFQLLVANQQARQQLLEFTTQQAKTMQLMQVGRGNI